MSSAIVLAKTGEGTFLASRLANEGHVTRVFVENGEPSYVGYSNPSRMVKLKDLPYDILVAGDGSLEVPTDQPVIGSNEFTLRFYNVEQYHNDVLQYLMDQDSLHPEDSSLDQFTLVTLWYSQGELVPVSFLHLVYSRMLEGGRGCQIPAFGQGVATKLWPAERLLVPLMPRLNELMHKVQYTGPVVIRFHVDEDIVYYHGIDFRMYAALHTGVFELVKLPLFDFLWRLSIGEQDIPVREDYALSLRLSTPPFPYGLDYPVDGYQVINFEHQAMNHVYLDGLRQERGAVLLAGNSGRIGWVTARGESVQEARRRLFRTVKNARPIPEVQYRRDVGNEMEELINLLDVGGWQDA